LKINIIKGQNLLLLLLLL